MLSNQLSCKFKLFRELSRLIIKGILQTNWIIHLKPLIYEGKAGIAICIDFFR